MASLVRHVTIDCADAYALGGFWAAALNSSLAEDDYPGDPEATVESPGATLLFVTVPERKAATVKNRVHLDLQPQDRTRDEEVERLLALGATLVADHRRPDGTGWATLADPEGNEFCVERSAAERAAGAGQVPRP
ncbi:VOC family protein [Streptomyces sp. JJ36]|uniref:VOC family protein n=1 Tax=Streptomyces sp. JJ36 TaxID=2736645 RepID=UPI001F3B02B0|nr:VOC family protein [Streptomyces sp. JJ36]MCF6524232.1 VOC family protein [Streptomyces sp. JJ36]